LNEIFRDQDVILKSYPSDILELYVDLRACGWLAISLPGFHFRSPLDLAVMKYGGNGEFGLPKKQFCGMDEKSLFENQSKTPDRS